MAAGRDLPLYTRAWGEPQADRYITGSFDAFDRIEPHGVASRPVPAEFGVQGFFFRYERHFVYWPRLSNGDIGIVTILQERMHQIGRLRSRDFPATSTEVTGNIRPCSSVSLQAAPWCAGLRTAD